MSSPYDQNLLAEAPKPSKALIQDGYNADLLREPSIKRKAPPSLTHTPPPRSNSDPNDLESAQPLQPKPEYITSNDDSDLLPQTKKKAPLWRTQKGLAILIVLVIAIILAAVLGGVLGSRKPKEQVNSDNQSAGISTVTPSEAVGPRPSSTASLAPLPSTNPNNGTESGGNAQTGTQPNGGLGGTEPVTNDSTGDGREFAPSRGDTTPPTSIDGAGTVAGGGTGTTGPSGGGFV